MNRGAILFGLLCFIAGLIFGVLLTLYFTPQTVEQQHASAELIRAQARIKEAEAEQMRIDARAAEMALPTLASVKVVSAWLTLLVVPSAAVVVCLVAVLWYRRSHTLPDARPVSVLSPGPTFAREEPRQKSFVYVRSASTGEKNKRDLQDVREFLERGAVMGFSRADWVGHNIHFGSGHDCTRTRYDELIQMCNRANVIEPEGKTWRLACSLDEALDCFSDGESIDAEAN